MWEIIIGALGIAMSAAATIVVAIIETRAGRDRARTAERATRRERESRLSMEMMSANMDLAYVTSLAVTGGHTNGNVEAAQNKALAAKDAYETFLKDEAAHAVAKI